MPNHMDDVLLHAMEVSELSRVRTEFNQLRILPIVSPLCRVPKYAASEYTTSVCPSSNQCSPVALIGAMRHSPEA